jgi:hypothetical protein
MFIHFLKESHDIMLHYSPAILVESHGKTIRSRCLVPLGLLDNPEDFLLIKSSLLQQTISLPNRVKLKTILGLQGSFS